MCPECGHQGLRAPVVGEARTAEELGRAYDELFGRWLPGSGFQPDSRPLFELYGANPLDEKTGRFTLDLCVPIRPL